MEEILRIIRGSEAVLLGFGDEFTEKKAKREKILSAYNRLAALVAGKPWFAVTVNTDDLIYESDLSRFFIVAPCGSDAAGNVASMEDYDESAYLPQWEMYRNFLAAVLGKKLCILELGVGLLYPSVIRFPFEKLALCQQKAALVRVHSKLAQAPAELGDRAVCVAQNPVEWLNFTQK